MQLQLLTIIIIIYYCYYYHYNYDHLSLKRCIRHLVEIGILNNIHATLVRQHHAAVATVGDGAHARREARPSACGRTRSKK